MFEHLKTNADHLAADAARLRRERNAHARRSYAIVQRRVSSPPGLVLCFGAGVFAGARLRHRELHPEHERRHDRRPARREIGLTEWLLHGPLGAAAIKLGTAFIAGAADCGNAPPTPRDSTAAA